MPNFENFVNVMLWSKAKMCKCLDKISNSVLRLKKNLLICLICKVHFFTIIQDV